MGYCTSNIKSPRYRFIDWIFYFFFFFLADLQTMQYFIAYWLYAVLWANISPFLIWFSFCRMKFLQSKIRLITHTLLLPTVSQPVMTFRGQFFFPLINDSGNSGKGANPFFLQNCRETSIIIWLVKSSRELKVIFT